MKYILLLSMIISTLSCNNSSRQVIEEGETSNNPILKTNEQANDSERKEELPGCYMKITGRDTAIITIDQIRNEISGKMLYDNFEKDGSFGTIKGKQDGDILKLYYDFNAEGMHSVMEVYFKKVAGGLLRGVGDMNMKGDTTYFTSGVNYSDKEGFSKIDCSLVKRKFK